MEAISAVRHCGTIGCAEGYMKKTKLCSSIFTFNDSDDFSTMSSVMSGSCLISFEKKKISTVPEKKINSR